MTGRPLRVAVFSIDARDLACPYLRFQSPADASGGEVELIWAANGQQPGLQVDLDRVR